VLKIITIIKDVIEKNKIKAYLSRAKRKIKNIDFELVKEFDDNRQAVKFLYQNSDIDIIIVENKAEEIFSGLDLLTLAEKEFNKSSILLLNENENELELDYENINNLTAIFNKNENYSVFANLLFLTMLKQKRKKDKFEKEENKLNDYRTIIDHTHDAIFLVKVDCDNNFYYKRINGTHQRLTALTNEEIKDKKLEEIFDKEVAEKLEENYNKCLRKKGRINYTEKLDFPSGKKIWQTTLYPVMKNGRVEEIVGASYDISNFKKKEKRLSYIKRYDGLTGLYNKEYFNYLFKELNKSKKDNLALILINVESFHLINKFFGYQQGDKILQEIAAILVNITGEDIIPAHLSDDHFAVILKNKDNSEIAKTLNLIKKELIKININGIYIDTAAVSMVKVNNKKTVSDFFGDGVSKIKFNRYKQSQESKFYNSLMNYMKDNNYIKLGDRSGLLEISKKAASYFNLNQKDKNELLLLARHYDIGKLTLDKNIVKKGEKLTAEEWQEYKKYVINSANFAAYYHDLIGVCNLIYSQHEHYDGSGWPQALKAKQIPYLSRFFAVINFYSKLKSNIYFPLLKDKYYFGALKDEEIIKEFNHYKSNIFDPEIVDRFIDFLNNENK
jgi:diguanylate cyclase (GGDEF)-like protein/PAS domain S-box-containing protein